MLAPLAERFASQRSIEIKRFSSEKFSRHSSSSSSFAALRFTGYIKEAAPVANDTLLQKLAPKYLTENSFATCSFERGFRNKSYTYLSTFTCRRIWRSFFANLNVAKSWTAESS